MSDEECVARLRVSNPSESNPSEPNPSEPNSFVGGFGGVPVSRSSGGREQEHRPLEPATHQLHASKGTPPSSDKGRLASQADLTLDCTVPVESQTENNKRKRQKEQRSKAAEPTEGSVTLETLERLLKTPPLYVRRKRIKNVPTPPSSSNPPVLDLPLVGLISRGKYNTATSTYQLNDLEAWDKPDDQLTQKFPLVLKFYNQRLESFMPESRRRKLTALTPRQVLHWRQWAYDRDYIDKIDSFADTHQHFSKRIRENTFYCDDPNLGWVESFSLTYPEILDSIQPYTLQDTLGNVLQWYYKYAEREKLRFFMLAAARSQVGEKIKHLEEQQEESCSLSDRKHTSPLHHATSSPFLQSTTTTTTTTSSSLSSLPCGETVKELINVACEDPVNILKYRHFLAIPVSSNVSTSIVLHKDRCEDRSQSLRLIKPVPVMFYSIDRERKSVTKSQLVAEIKRHLLSTFASVVPHVLQCLNTSLTELSGMDEQCALSARKTLDDYQQHIIANDVLQSARLDDLLNSAEIHIIVWQNPCHARDNDIASEEDEEDEEMVVQQKRAKVVEHVDEGATASTIGETQHRIEMEKRVVNDQSVQSVQCTENASPLTNRIILGILPDSIKRSKQIWNWSIQPPLTILPSKLQ